MGPMTENLAPASNRRNGQRFSKNAPLSVLIGDREIPAYTRDLSNRGVYFYLDISHSSLVESDFDFMVKFPPEVTISNLLLDSWPGPTAPQGEYLWKFDRDCRGNTSIFDSQGSPLRVCATRVRDGQLEGSSLHIRVYCCCRDRSAP